MKLPEPLSYDYVDELIDETFMFFERGYTGAEDGLTLFACRRRDGSVSTHIGLLFSVKDDTAWEYENEDGYCEWFPTRQMDEEDMVKWDGASKDDDLPYEFTGVIR